MWPSFYLMKIIAHLNIFYFFTTQTNNYFRSFVEKLTKLVDPHVDDMEKSFN